MKIVQSAAFAFVVVCALAASLAAMANPLDPVASAQTPDPPSDPAAIAPAVAGHTISDSLRHGGAGPQMVVLAGGEYWFGAAPKDPAREADDAEQTRISIAPFALARTEVTRSQFAAFVDSTGHRTAAENNVEVPLFSERDGCLAHQDDGAFRWRLGSSWRDPGFKQEDDHPVVCISWNDAQAYVEWLSAESGKHYRLPREAELEFAIRAGSNTPWPWGDTPEPACRYANGRDSDAAEELPDSPIPANSCRDGSVFTSPVANYAGNVLGLFDTVGNVSEWTEDCLFGRELAKLPANTLQADGCLAHIIRSGSWLDRPTWLRSAYRDGFVDSFRMANLGLRVARDL